MIKLDLGAEPAELRIQRELLLPQAVQAFNAHGYGSQQLNELLDEGYKVARPMLEYRQHGKCAFCESIEDKEMRPVEHFRPKKEAHDETSGSLVVDKSHYWWLAWSWSNLYFSCIRCNKNGNKGSRFPIVPGGARVSAPVTPLSYPIPASFYDLSKEPALLVDPRIDDPFDHLQWTPVDRTASRSTWRWNIEGLSGRGTETIKVFGLKDRIDRVNQHLKYITSAAIEIDKHLNFARIDDAKDAFVRLVELYVNDSSSPFRNAAYWALDCLYPEDTRAVHGFRDLLQPYDGAREGPLPRLKSGKSGKAVKAVKAVKSAKANVSP